MRRVEPERLDQARGVGRHVGERVRGAHGPAGHHGAEGLEDVREDAEQRVGTTGFRQPERRRADRLGVGAVDDRTYVATDEPDAVARAEDREVAIHDLVQHAGEHDGRGRLGRYGD